MYAMHCCEFLQAISCLFKKYRLCRIVEINKDLLVHNLGWTKLLAMELQSIFVRSRLIHPTP